MKFWDEWPEGISAFVGLLFLILLYAFPMGFVSAYVQDTYPGSPFFHWLSLAVTFVCISVVLGFFLHRMTVKSREKEAVESQQQMDKQSIEQQKAKRQREQDYLRWCDEAKGEDKVLKAAVDGLLTLHNWDGMPRIKARLNPDMESTNDRSAHYVQGFEWRERGSQVIEYKPSHYRMHSERDILGILKHELVHAWIDWKGIKMSDAHGPEFQQKMNEVGY